MNIVKTMKKINKPVDILAPINKAASTTTKAKSTKSAKVETAKVALPAEPEKAKPKRIATEAQKAALAKGRETAKKNKEAKLAAAAKEEKDYARDPKAKPKPKSKGRPIEPNTIQKADPEAALPVEAINLSNSLNNRLNQLDKLDLIMQKVDRIEKEQKSKNRITASKQEDLEAINIEKPLEPIQIQQESKEEIKEKLEKDKQANTLGLAPAEIEDKSKEVKKPDNTSSYNFKRYTSLKKVPRI